MTAKLVIFADNIDKITNIIGSVFSLLTITTVIVMFLSVLQRYLFNFSYIWQQELVRYMHAMCFMALSGYTLMKGEHVRVDIFYHNFSSKVKSYVEIIGTVIFLLPFSIAILILSDNFIIRSWKILEPSTEPGGLPFICVLKSFIAIFSITLILQSLSVISRNLSNIIKER